MNNLIKISIADKNPKIKKLFLKSIREHQDMQLVSVSNDGELCLKNLDKTKPDILIMDLLLPKVAGFEILEYIKNDDNYRDLIIIIMTTLTDDDTVREVQNYNVKYILDKPFNIDYLLVKARKLYRIKLLNDANMVKEKIIYDKKYDDINKILLNIGLKPHLNGFNYLKTAIYKASRDVNLLSAVTKELYPLIGSIYEIEPKNIERSMRNAIENAWKNKTKANQAIKTYGYKTKLNKRPSNSTFIAIISIYLRSLGPKNESY